MEFLQLGNGDKGCRQMPKKERGGTLSRSRFIADREPDYLPGGYNHHPLLFLPDREPMRLQPVILSGGSGTRLWPLSREAYPKQFLPLTSEHTMLQETVRRLDGLDREHPRRGIGLVATPLVVCNEAHRFLVAEQFRLIGRAAARRSSWSPRAATPPRP